MVGLSENWQHQTSPRMQLQHCCRINFNDVGVTEYRIKINIQKEKQTNKKKEEKSEKALNMTFAVHLMSAVGSTWWPYV